MEGRISFQPEKAFRKMMDMEEMRRVFQTKREVKSDQKYPVFISKDFIKERSRSIQGSQRKIMDSPNIYSKSFIQRPSINKSPKHSNPTSTS